MPLYAGVNVPVSSTAGTSSISANSRRAEAKVWVRLAGNALNASVGPKELAISTTAANSSPTPSTSASPYQASTRANAPASAVANTTITPPMPPNRPLFRLSLTR